MAKRITAQNVAEKAGVSITTVSFVLNNVIGPKISEETRERVLNAARELDYHPNASAQKMARGRTNVIGLILRQDPEKAYADLFLPSVMQGVSSIARPSGYQILFIPLPPDASGREFNQLIQERHVDGLIVSGPTDDDTELEGLCGDGGNVVLIGKLLGSRVPFVDINNVEAAAKAVNHLANLGHKRIGFISNAPLKYYSSRERESGYRMALNQNEIDFDSSIVKYGDFTPESGYQAIQEILNISDRPTAVFVASDTVAIGAIHALHENQLKIPEDMAVVGFDDIPISKFLNPPLSTVHSPAYSLGQAAASMLIQQLTEGTPIQEEVILHTQLVIRESSDGNNFEGRRWQRKKL
jgi:LacI family transcriptional regulator